MLCFFLFNLIQIFFFTICNLYLASFLSLSSLKGQNQLQEFLSFFFSSLIMSNPPFEFFHVFFFLFQDCYMFHFFLKNFVEVFCSYFLLQFFLFTFIFQLGFFSQLFIFCFIFFCQGLQLFLLGFFQCCFLLEFSIYIYIVIFYNFI